jgi:SAM-dependent methyltransferase
MVEAGLDVDGCDISTDMLALCRQRAERQRLTPRLYQQAMHQIEMPRVYRTIYICDSFGLGGNREHDVEALRRCYARIAPGGVLVFSHYLPYDDPRRWPYWLPEQRKHLPEPWPETGTRKRTANGDEIEIRSRAIDLDPMEQRLTLEMRADLWRDGRLLEQEERLLQETLYFRNEMLLLLANAGFTGVSVRAGYSADEATADDTSLVFVAWK